MRQYFFTSTLLTMVSMLAFYLTGQHIALSDHPFTWWVLPLAFYAISLPGHALLLRSYKGKPDQFMVYFLLANTVKMLLYLALLLIWFLISGQQLSMAFIIAFSILYAAITALDLVSVFYWRRKQP